MADYNKNQLSIIRQNQIRFVFDYSKGLGIDLTLKDIVAITNVMVTYCDEGYSSELSTRLDKVDELLKTLK
jgi:hypothetical protein